MNLEYFIKSLYLIPSGYSLESLHSVDMHYVTSTVLDTEVTKMNK